MNEFILVWRWWLVMELLGLIAFPLVACVARNLEDRGYCIAKALGLLLLSYLVWIISTARVLPFGYGSILVALLVVGGAGVWLSRNGFSLREMPVKKMVLTDLVFLVAFGLFAFILRYKPDLYFAYSEDFMDFAFTQAILRTDYFPPQDPWMSGKSMSYYYGGFLFAANLIKISHVPASFAPNLVVATFFALTATAVYGLVSNVIRSTGFGLLAALMVCVSGYLSGAFQYVAALTKQDFMGYKPLLTPSWKDWLLSFNFWDANRIIPGTLNYYPYFSFLQSDMHPPTLSFPFQATFLVLVVVFVRTAMLKPPQPVPQASPPVGNPTSPLILFEGGAGGSQPVPQASPPVVPVLGGLMALNLGYLFFIHSWDYPIYVMVFGLAALMFKRSWTGLVFTGAVIVASVLFFLPYNLSGVGGGFQGLGRVTDRSEVSAILEMLAVFLFSIVTMLYIMSMKSSIKGWQVALFASAGIMAAFVFKFPLLVFLAPAIVLPLYFLLTRNDGGRGSVLLRVEAVIASGAKQSRVGDTDMAGGTTLADEARGSVPLLGGAPARHAVPLRDGDRLMLFFVLAGALVIFFAEVLYLRDALRGAVARFNTVLKLYYSVWLLWGLAAAMAFKYVMGHLGRVTRYLWLFPALVLLAASLVHPVATTTGWTSGRHTVFGVNRGTLDGTAYLKSLQPADYEAVNWVQQNISGAPVILEAPGAPYGYSSRVASLTGLPTVVGWGMHEIMWRNDWAGVGERTNDIDNIYNGNSDVQVMALLRKYDVRYVYVGSLETQKYRPEGLAKFRLRSDLFRPVYSNQGAQIFEVIYGS
ncbi:MAG: hypothetical protein HYY29_04595 [Chloroflexi bacterium]|nr:hypothetical protein [Chloroflexota bacterium]